jgi:hypothetical protein
LAAFTVFNVSLVASATHFRVRMVILRLKPPRRIACTEPDTRDRQLLAENRT